VPEIPLSFYRKPLPGTGLGTLMERGRRRMVLFCRINRIIVPSLQPVPEAEWLFSACAYYRPQYIRICLPLCGRVCSEHETRNWTYPGSTTDREPYGVVLHELGHHADWTAGTKKGSYFSDYGEDVCARSREEPISGYHPNEAEWFAEMFRVFVSNPDLLRLIRPRTYRILTERWKTVTENDWRTELGPDCPRRVVAALEKKVRGRR
jgi:hypothetical protein